MKPKFLGQVQSVNRRDPSSRSRTGFPGSPLAWSQATHSASADATLFPGGSKQLCREQSVRLSPKGQCWEVGEGRGGAFSSYGVHLAHEVWGRSPTSPARLEAHPECCIGSAWPAPPKSETPQRVGVNSSNQIALLLSCSEKGRGAWELGVFWGVGKRNLQIMG